MKNTTFYATKSAPIGTYWKSFPNKREREAYIEKNPEWRKITAREHNRPKRGVHYRQF